MRPRSDLRTRGVPSAERGATDTAEAATIHRGRVYLIYGKYPVIATRYGEEAIVALPTGAYTVRVIRKDAAERTATAVIEAGKRSDLTVD